MIRKINYLPACKLGVTIKNPIPVIIKPIKITGQFINKINTKVLIPAYDMSPKPARIIPTAAINIPIILDKMYP